MLKDDHQLVLQKLVEHIALGENIVHPHNEKACS